MKHKGMYRRFNNPVEDGQCNSNHYEVTPLVFTAILHLLAASGAVEFGTTVLALQHQIVPPTLNLNEPEPECTLEFVSRRARRAEIETAITISRGIGGQNAVTVLRRWEP